MVRFLYKQEPNFLKWWKCKIIQVQDYMQIIIFNCHCSANILCLNDVLSLLSRWHQISNLYGKRNKWIRLWTTFLSILNMTFYIRGCVIYIYIYWCNQRCKFYHHSIFSLNAKGDFFLFFFYIMDTLNKIKVNDDWEALNKMHH